MPEMNNIFIDDPKRLRDPIKTIEVSELNLFLTELMKSVKISVTISSKRDYHLDK